MTDVKGGSVYLNKVMTPELELEGYAREITRRVQQLRKDSNLNKRDVIELFISTELEIDNFSDMIKEKCGASKVLFQEGSTFNKFDATVSEKIKGKEVKIGFNKV
jgi:isoleucyl-tRNA synthetase